MTRREARDARLLRAVEISNSAAQQVRHRYEAKSESRRHFAAMRAQGLGVIASVLDELRAKK